jgi:hypothetical protein
MRILALVLAAVVLIAAPASAVEVTVTATGTVGFNGITDAPLGTVSPGDHVEMSFKVDSNDFMDGVPGDVRGYVIDQSSFSLSFDTPLDMGLLNPFPGTAYFNLVDGFPVSDGFSVSSSNVSPGGVALAQEPFNFNLDLGYTGDTLSSLNILDALGSYGFDGLTRFGMNLWSIFPDNVVMDMEFQKLTIVPEPTTLALLLPLGCLLLRRRR